MVKFKYKIQIQTDRQTDRKIEKQRDRVRNRQTDTKRGRERRTWFIRRNDIGSRGQQLRFHELAKVGYTIVGYATAWT